MYAAIMKNLYIFFIALLYNLAMPQDLKNEKNITVDEVLNVLDNSNKDAYNIFVSLGEPYSYLIDARLNVFRCDDNRWAIAVERLGYNPRGGYVTIDIYYYGNCILPIESFGNPTNNHSVLPIDSDNFENTTDGEALTKEAAFWIVRKQKVSLSHKKKDYRAAGIELREYEPDEISIEEAARLAITKHRELFRATDAELYKAIPTDLRKILVLDEWYHKDFMMQYEQVITEIEIQKAYNYSKSIGSLTGITFEDFKSMIVENEKEAKKNNQDSWKNNRPGSYETWQQLALVIATNNVSHYKPTLKPNTHWKNWPESGSL